MKQVGNVLISRVTPPDITPEDVEVTQHSANLTINGWSTEYSQHPAADVAVFQLAGSFVINN